MFILQDPVKIVLGTRRVQKGHGRKRRLVEKEDTLVYVPILKTLQVILNDDGILAEVSHCETTLVRIDLYPPPLFPVPSTLSVYTCRYRMAMCLHSLE